MFLRHIVQRQPVQKPPRPRSDSSGYRRLNEAPRRIPPLCGLSRVLLVSGKHRPFAV